MKKLALFRRIGTGLRTKFLRTGVQSDLVVVKVFVQPPVVPVVACAVGAQLALGEQTLDLVVGHNYAGLIRGAVAETGSVVRDGRAFDLGFFGSHGVILSGIPLAEEALWTGIGHSEEWPSASWRISHFSL